MVRMGVRKYDLRHQLPVNTRRLQVFRQLPSAGHEVRARPYIDEDQLGWCAHQCDVGGRRHKVGRLTKPGFNFRFAHVAREKPRRNCEMPVAEDADLEFAEPKRVVARRSSKSERWR
jgi:hypothetical protein